MNKVIVITGASSGFGALTARALSRAGHTVYATMRETTGRNASQVEEAKKFSEENRVDLRTRMRRAGLTLRGGEPDPRGERGGSGEDRSGLENFATTLLSARHGVFLLLVLQCAIADIPRLPGRLA